MIVKNCPATDAEIEILSLIAEECAEVIQIVSKINRFGFNSFRPNDEDKLTNRILLESELGDLLALVEIAIDKKIVNWDNIYNALESKKERLKVHSNIYSEVNQPSCCDELDKANSFINDAFTAHPNLDIDVENVRKRG